MDGTFWIIFTNGVVVVETVVIGDSDSRLSNVRNAVTLTEYSVIVSVFDIGIDQEMFKDFSVSASTSICSGGLGNNSIYRTRGLKIKLKFFSYINIYTDSFCNASKCLFSIC